MKNIFWLFILIFSAHPSFSQVWEATTPMRVLSLFPTMDEGFIISGGAYGNETNLSKIDKLGNSVWNKSIFDNTKNFHSNNVVIGAEVSDGFLGTSYCLSFCDEPYSVFFKINNNGDTLYSINGVKYENIKTISGNNVLIYDNYLIKFNHITREFLWEKNFGNIKDLYGDGNQYHILTTEGLFAYYLIVDIDGNQISKNVISTLLPSKFLLRFFNKTIIFYDYNSENHILSNISFNGDTLWKNILKTKDIYRSSRPFLNFGKEHIFLSGIKTSEGDMFYRYDAKGTLNWKYTCWQSSFPIIMEVQDGIIAMCSTSVKKEGLPQYSSLHKLEGSNNVALNINNSNHEFAANQWKVQLNGANNNQTLLFTPVFITNNTNDFEIEIFDMLGRLNFKDKITDGEVLSLPFINSIPGIYIYTILQNGSQITKGMISF